MYHVKNLINYSECAAKIQKVLPQFSASQISKAFEKYFKDSSLWEQDLVYTKTQAEKFVHFLMVDFIAEQQNETRSSAEVALKLEMPIGAARVHQHYPAGGLL